MQKLLIGILSSVLIIATGFIFFQLYKQNQPPPQPQIKTDNLPLTQQNATTEIEVEEEAESTTPDIAFFYQYVGKMNQGVGENGVRLGFSDDYTTVESTGLDAVQFTVSKTETDIYGDPVFSRLSDGSWALTSWSSPEDTRGGNYLIYYESSCPVVDDDKVIVIGPSTASGCAKMRSLTGGKSSQVFAADDGNYVFHMIGGEVYLAHLSDAEHSAMDLETMCVLETPVTDIADLDYGESTLILSQEKTNLLLSDTAIGRRADGTWVLFVKGIEKDNGCTPNTTCELCARGVYRTTSTDLVNWSSLEKVVSQASVPEAFTTVDGTVWLYWQDFSDTCAADDQKLGGIAPISAAYEQEGSYELSEPLTVSFPDEEFETDKTMHYATNANPVTLPNAAAKEALEGCVS